MKGYLVILLCMISAVVQAQTNLVTGNSLDAYWNFPTIPSQAQATLKLGTSNIPSPSSSINEVITRQEGNANSAMLSVISGSYNRLEVNQNASQNTVDATLSGVNNSVLLNQTGGGNTISFGLNGVNNNYSLTQDGGDHIQMQGLVKTNSRLEVNQGSGSNSLTLDNSSLFKDATGTGIPNLRIEQSGGATAIIQNGRIFGN